MNIPILLYVDHEEVGEIESINLTIEPDVGVVMSIIREARVGTEEDPEPEEAPGQAPSLDEELSDEDLEVVINKSVDDRMKSGLPSSVGILDFTKLEDRIDFSDADMLALQRVSLLRIHPMFFSAQPPVKEPKKVSNEFSSPIEAYPELKQPGEEKPPYELQLGRYTEETHKFEDVELGTLDPVFFMSGVETAEQISQLAQAEGMLSDKYPEALGFEEIDSPYYYFNPAYEEPETCTLHSVIRVWLPN